MTFYNQLPQAFLSISLLTVCTTSLFADGLSNASVTLVKPNPYRALATFSVGPDFTNAGQAQTLTLLPPYQNHYTAEDTGKAVADTGLFLGVERMFSNRLFAQLGVSGYVDSDFTPKGHVWQFNSPLFDNLTYLYHIHHTRVMVEGKLLTNYPSHPDILPYFSWQLGVAFNQTSGYQETPLIPDVPPTAPFAGSNQSAFAYGVGLGIDYNLNQHVRLGLGYQFADLGSASLGVTAAEAIASTLVVPHLYTNQLRFQLTVMS